MAKYDGKFVRLNCFNTLYDDFEPYIIDILPALKNGDSYQLHVLRRYSRRVLAADLLTRFTSQARRRCPSLMALYVNTTKRLIRRYFILNKLSSQ